VVLQGIGDDTQKDVDQPALIIIPPKTQRLGR